MRLRKTITPLLWRVIVFFCLFVLISGIVGPRIIASDILFRDGFAVYGSIGKALLFGLIAFVLLARHNKPEVTLKPWQPILLGWMLLSALLLALAWVNISRLLEDERDLQTLVLAHGGLLFSLVAAAIGCIGPQNIRLLWNGYRREIMSSAAIAVLFYGFLLLVYALWRPLASFVLWGVNGLLGLSGLDATIIPPNVLLFDKFGITVAEYCSGVESIALFTGLYVIVGLLDWKRIHKKRYFAIFPFALITLCLFNVVRVYGLIIAGYHINPEIAFSLFHTYAGMVFFILFSGIFWAVAYKYLIEQPGGSMKILQIISYGYLAGGAEKSVLLLKEELGRRGHQVMVVSSDHNKNGSEQRFSDREFFEIDSPGTSLAAKVIKHLWYTPAYRAIKAAIADFRPDIVHFHVMGQLSPSALFALGEVPGVLTVHGPEEYVSGILEWGFPKHLFKTERVAVSNLTALGKGYYKYFRYLQRPIYKQGFRKHLAAMIAPSQYMASLLEKEAYGIPVRQVYNGIALPRQRPLQNKHRLLYAGRLEHVKGVDVLLRAMPEIVRSFPKVLLSIVGDGAARPELETFVGRHRLQKNVVFQGWLDTAAVSDQYSQATAVVIPSIWPENLPTVCIEALATGRPVIGTNSGGIPELIQDGATGRIVAAGDADELAAGILDVLSRPDLPAISHACAASMQNFQITAFVRNLERLYQRLLDNTLEEI